MRVLVEALHIAAGIAAALVIGGTMAWAYPLGARDIWMVTAVAVLCVILMGIGPMRRAARATRAQRDGDDE
ncbi:hypothetical protein [Sphingomonas sp.]|uniref:hypothetical protein n=1 Tax=Sphingomonas sp. TaxID=28214 RepID=UPI001EBBE4E3|nr:hypothetical protein [Sphingomonas sp.]MBX3594443.1 hypothetical protein [Sphingomonas sp.]